MFRFLIVCVVFLGASTKSMLPFSMLMLFRENLKGLFFSGVFVSSKSEKL